MADEARKVGGGDERVDLLHLPMPDAELFGRDRDRAWLEDCWRERAHVASIVAPGGVGKSALVCDWLRGMQAEGWREAERVYGWSFYSQGTKETQSSADYFVDEALVFFGDTDPDAGSPWDKGERLARLMRREAGSAGAGWGRAASVGAGAGGGRHQGSGAGEARKEVGGAERGAVCDDEPARGAGCGGVREGEVRQSSNREALGRGGRELVEGAGGEGEREGAAGRGP